MELTKESFAKRWAGFRERWRYRTPEPGATREAEKHILSDLNALLRTELIGFLDKRDHTVTLSVLGNIEAVDLYLKSKQK